MERIILTIEYINSHIGEVINWFAYGNSQNLPYSGKCKLLGMTKDARHIRPLVEHISGDEMSYGFIDYDNKTVTYTDNDRPVYVGKEFELYTLQWEVPTMHMLFSDNSCMNYSIIVYLTEGSETLLSKMARKTNAKIVRVEETGIIYIRDNTGNFKVKND